MITCPQKVVVLIIQQDRVAFGKACYTTTAGSKDGRLSFTLIPSQIHPTALHTYKNNTTVESEIKKS